MGILSLRISRVAGGSDSVMGVEGTSKGFDDEASERRSWRILEQCHRNLECEVSLPLTSSHLETLY